MYGTVGYCALPGAPSRCRSGSRVNQGGRLTDMRGNIVERILVQNYPGRGHRRWFPKGALTVVALFSVRQMHYDVGGAAEGLVFI